MILWCKLIHFPGRSLFDLGGLLMDLQDLLGHKVDVVTERGLRERIRERVLREAKSLWGIYLISSYTWYDRQHYCRRMLLIMINTLLRHRNLSRLTKWCPCIQVSIILRKSARTNLKSDTMSNFEDLWGVPTINVDAIRTSSLLGGHLEPRRRCTMKQFTTIEKLDTAILYLLELASRLSVLLLAFGLRFLHTFGESNIAELRIHFQKSLFERMDVSNAFYWWACITKFGEERHLKGQKHPATKESRTPGYEAKLMHVLALDHTVFFVNDAKNRWAMMTRHWSRAETCRNNCTLK